MKKLFLSMVFVCVLMAGAAWADSAAGNDDVFAGGNLQVEKYTDREQGLAESGLLLFRDGKDSGAYRLMDVSERNYYFKYMPSNGSHIKFKVLYVALPVNYEIERNKSSEVNAYYICVGSPEGDKGLVQFMARDGQLLIE